MELLRTVAEYRVRARARAASGRVRADDGRVSRRATCRSFEAARRGSASTVVVSLFVNPAQFGEHEPTSSATRATRRATPRWRADAGVDLLFAPGPSEMYPDGYETWVDRRVARDVLEGASRPGHFRGVATVCLKLFNIVQPARRLTSVRRTRSRWR